MSALGVTGRRFIPTSNELLCIEKNSSRVVINLYFYFTIKIISKIIA